MRDGAHPPPSTLQKGLGDTLPGQWPGEDLEEHPSRFRVGTLRGKGLEVCAPSATYGAERAEGSNPRPGKVCEGTPTRENMGSTPKGLGRYPRALESWGAALAMGGGKDISKELGGAP